MASDFTWCDLWIYLYIYISSLLPLHVPVAYLTVSHFLLWEKLLCKELTPVSAETSTFGCCLGMAHTHTPWWNQDRKSCGSGFQMLQPPDPVQDHLALRQLLKERKGWKGSAFPLWESLIQHLPHTSASHMLQNHESWPILWYHSHRNFNVEKKVWRIWVLMRQPEKFCRKAMIILPSTHSLMALTFSYLRKTFSLF